MLGPGVARSKIGQGKPRPPVARTAVFNNVHARMIRVLHLLDHPTDFQTQRSAHHLAGSAGRNADVRGKIRTIGRGGDDPTPIAAIRRLRRGLAEAEAEIVHAWGTAALGVAALAGVPRIVYSPAGEHVRRAIQWVRAVMAYRNVQVVCPTATLRRLHVQAGVAMERCHLIRPGVDFARVRRRRDEALRTALGFSNDDRVILAASESTAAASHEEIVWAMSILHLLDQRYRLLLWGRGERAGAVARFAAKLDQPRLVVLAQQKLGRKLEFEELLPSTDIVLSAPAGVTATLPMCICMAAGLPIVSTVTYTIGELLEDRHTALLTTHPTPRAIARRVLDLEEDARLQWSISDMARTEAYEFFSLTRFLEQHRMLYRQFAADEDVEIPAPAPGAGLRFHGRA
jgi:glycosyltransferase involved in cell wall biosynthesis